VKGSSGVTVNATSGMLAKRTGRFRGLDMRLQDYDFGLDIDLVNRETRKLKK
jgi:hypothetical protein